MFEVGRVCFKIAGRDSNKYCVIVEKVDDTFVIIDGQTRRKKVNVKHIEPTDKVIEIKAGADHSVVVEAFSKLDIKIPLKKSKKPTERQKKVKAVKVKKEKKAPKAEKKATVKEEKPVVKKEEVKTTPKAEVKESPKVEKPETELEKSLKEE